MHNFNWHVVQWLEHCFRLELAKAYQELDYDLSPYDRLQQWFADNPNVSGDTL